MGVPIHQGKLARSAGAFVSDDRGFVAIITALALPALIGVVALALDASRNLAEKSTLQGVADSAARTAALIRARSGATYAQIADQALAVAAYNGYQHGQNGVSITVNAPPATGNFTYYPSSVEVIIDETSEGLLGAWFGSPKSMIRARAVADYDFVPCIVALNLRQNGSQTGISIGGAGTFNAKCGLYSNNPDPSKSITVNGGATINVYSAAMVGNTTSIINGALFPNQDPFANPFGDLKYSKPAGTTDATWNSGTNTLSCSAASKVCGVPKSSAFYGSLGKAQTTTIQSGTYYLDDAYAQTNSGSVVNAISGVTLVTNPGFSVGAGARFNLVAPTSGPFPGMGLVSDYGSRSGENKLQGWTGQGAAANVQGSIIIPWADLQFNGGITAGEACFTIVANSISIGGGGSTLGKDCTPAEMNNSSYLGGHLVE